MKRELHGLSNTPSYEIWCNMKSRCYNEHTTFYSEYGGRGIKVCDRWKESFLAFFQDMGDRPDGMTIDRIDNNKGYEPGNCEWATRKTQARNRRGRHYLSACGKTQMLAQWADDTGISISTLWARIKYGWTPDAVVLTKIGGAGFGPKPKMATAAAREVDLNYREHA